MKSSILMLPRNKDSFNFKLHWDEQHFCIMFFAVFFCSTLPRDGRCFCIKIRFLNSSASNSPIHTCPHPPTPTNNDWHRHKQTHSNPTPTHSCHTGQYLPLQPAQTQAIELTFNKFSSNGEDYSIDWEINHFLSQTDGSVTMSFKNLLASSA